MSECVLAIAETTISEGLNLREENFMIQAKYISIQLLLVIPVQLPGIVTLLLGGACAFILSFLLTFVVRACCPRLEWLDRPSERRVHIHPVPRLGGLAMFLAFVIASLLFYAPECFECSPTRVQRGKRESKPYSSLSRYPSKKDNPINMLSNHN
jgi:hypothetical protein